MHYRLIAEEISALVPNPQAHVLDYGSGEALHADIVATAAGELQFREAAPGLRAGLQRRFAGNPRIRVTAPHEIARLPEHSYDHRPASGIAIPYPNGRERVVVLFRRREIRWPARSQRCWPRGPCGNRCNGVASLRQGQRLLLCRCWGLLQTLLSHYWRLRSRLGSHATPKRR